MANLKALIRFKPAPDFGIKTVIFTVIGQPLEPLFKPYFENLTSILDMVKEGCNKTTGNRNKGR